MPPTPKEISNNIDRAIDHLNAQWDLGLPRPHGIEGDQADETDRLAGKCSKLIRFLCFKTDDTKTALPDFEQSARHIHSQWVFKPSQEPGTLPVLPVTKSLVARKIGLVRLSDPQRRELLQLLYKILKEKKENYELARLSDAFSNEPASTLTASFATAPTSPVTETAPRREELSTPPRKLSKPESLKNEPDEPQQKHPATSKRTLGTSNGVSQTSRFEFPSAHLSLQRCKRQQTLSEFQQFQHVPPPRPLQAPDPISFDTVVSTAATSVFSGVGEENEGAMSNNTSMISSHAEDSQDLFPTQDYNEIFSDEQFSTSFNELSKVPSLPEQADHNLDDTFTVHALLPPHVPFWYCWELHRLAPLLDLKPIELYQRLEEIHRKSVTLEEVWGTIKELCRAKGLRTLPEKSGLPDWMVRQGIYMDDKTNKVAHFTAALDWNDDPSQGLLQLQLNPIQLEQSCRFERKFGADRFLTLSGPSFTPPKLSDKSRQHKNKDPPSYDEVVEFLATNSHFIAGRRWRICFVEKENAKGRANKARSQRSRIILFAESGFDIIPRPFLKLNIPILKGQGQHRNIMRQDLMQWHMPLDANTNSTDLRLFSRWSLGFSRTTPTVELKRHEFLKRPDELGDEPDDGTGRKVMNDGCALISHPLAKAIWAACGGEGEPPSAVQGRISGGKGLWLVDYQNQNPNVSERNYWIEVSESQLKIKPHPLDRVDADSDATLRTFEVLKFASECKPARLNIQLINVLENGGVPRSVLQEALQSDVQSFTNTLTEAMKDPRHLRLWMQEHARSSRLEANKVLGSFPSDRKEQIKLLLESGFHPQTCRVLIDNAYILLSHWMTNYVDKMRILIPHSTSVFCAPDPLGVLAPGEVYLGSSNPVTHPVTGIRENTLEDLEFLVARNPALLASDMQKCRSVYKHELRHYKNVILFPQRGDIPLASLLSGGDYDGDVVTCVWDPKIVRPFRNTNMPLLPNQIDCGMIQRSKPVSGIFNGRLSPDQAFNDYFRRCIAFNARPNLLGTCTSEHERLVYALGQRRHGDRLLHPGAVQLAALAGFLVDSNKQGWDLPEDVWYKVRKNASGLDSLPKPAYKNETAPRKISPGPYLNVMDFLKFDVAETLKEQVLREFVKLGQDEKVLNYDRDLSRPWLYWCSLVEEDKMKKRASRHRFEGGAYGTTTASPGATDLEILADLLEGEQGLLDHITEVKEQWSKLSSANRAGFESTWNEVKDWGDSKDFGLAVQTVYEKFRAIKPKRLDHEIGRRFEAEKDRPLSDWDLLKAACLHKVVCSKGTSFRIWVWFLAGRELCRLKALQHSGDIRIVVSEIHGLYKVDTKYARALLEGGLDEESEDNAVDEEDLMDDDVGLEMS
ncbi:uncharacterized protein Z519_07590 [Cladophialophora bantiana CBS 173.52]|uniref:RNA-dependent RNA polymerase n=1 Tax=Cladophialophora bantiana (strain ATCC 10958 / CBS 173.52 / CDC B-1940 / NIH 8579) TaxID=1442370 RepID=A0A0D2FYU1_CLAB1|nr:uncharacterized protein Z519_07590 [Cladophialophora bantiana CBS 173.52]KIW91622.1 hypothetical protein Z519_07590 [Cladophialophora bantiana CBS 173.52]